MTMRRLISVLALGLVLFGGCRKPAVPEEPEPVEVIPEEPAEPVDPPKPKDPVVYEVVETDFSAVRDTLHIGGKLFFPKGLEGRTPVVICCHGLSGDIADTVPYGQAAATMGFVACCFDFCGGPRGYSLSDGERADNTLLTEVADLAAVYEELSFRADIDSTRMVVMGGSQGGLVAALYAAEHPGKPKALGLLFPAFNIPDLVRLYTILMHGGPQNLPESVSYSGHTFWRKYAVEAYGLYPFDMIGAYEGPVLILHGDKDELVPLYYSQEALKEYKDAELIVLEGQKHGFDLNGRQQAIEYLKEFLSELFTK